MASLTHGVTASRQHVGVVVETMPETRILAASFVDDDDDSYS
jgi:hypothetical protein